MIEPNINSITITLVVIEWGEGGGGVKVCKNDLWVITYAGIHCVS